MKILIYILPFIWSIGLSQKSYYKPLNIGVKDGLVSETIRYIFKDSKGNIWYGTDVGVVKYNGNTLTQYSSRDGMSGDRVWSIDEDKSGNIWFACYGSGLSKFDGKRFVNYINDDHAALNNVRRIFVAMDGSVFAGADDGLFRLKTNGQIQSFSKLIGNANDKMQGGGFFQFHKDSILYVTIGKGECFYNLKEDTIYAIPENHKYFKTRGYIAKKINNELVVAGGAIKIFKDDTIYYHTLGEYGLNGPVWDVTYDGKGNYYMPAFGGGAVRNFGGIYKFNGKIIEDISERMNIMGTNFWSILYDKEYQALNIGSLESGIYILKNDAFNYTDITLSSKFNTEIAIDNNNNKWLYNSKKLIKINGLDTIDYSKQLLKLAFTKEIEFTSYRIDVYNNPNADSAWCEKYLKLHSYPYANVYVHPRKGTQEKGYFYSPKLANKLKLKIKNRKKYFTKSFTDKFCIISVVDDVDGNLWISSSTGLFKVDLKGNISTYEIPCGTIYIDKQNNLWTTPQYRHTIKISDLSEPYDIKHLNALYKDSPNDVVSYAETLNEVFFASWSSGIYI